MNENFEDYIEKMDSKMMMFSLKFLSVTGNIENSLEQQPLRRLEGDEYGDYLVKRLEELYERYDFLHRFELSHIVSRLVDTYYESLNRYSDDVKMGGFYIFNGYNDFFRQAHSTYTVTSLYESGTEIDIYFVTDFIINYLFVEYADGYFE